MQNLCWNDLENSCRRYDLGSRHGGFGVTITKSITIDGTGALAGITGSGTNGVNISAGASDVVTLRGLSIHRAGAGLHGVRYVSGGMLVIEDTVIEGFLQNSIDVAPTGAASLFVRNSNITGGANGVRIGGVAGRVSAALSNVSIRGAGNGVYTTYGAMDIIDSTISQSTGTAVLTDLSGTATVMNTLVSGNATAVMALPGSTVRLSNTDVFDNLTGFGCGGGTIASTGNNRKGGNVGGVLPVCNPNASVTVQ